MKSSMQNSSLGWSALFVLSCLAALCAGCSSPTPSSTLEASTSTATSSTSTVVDQATSTTEAMDSAQASSSTVAPAEEFDSFTVTGTGDQLIPFSIPGDVIATLTIAYDGDGSFEVRDYYTGFEDDDDCFDCDYTNLYLTEEGPYHGRRLVNHRLLCTYEPSVPIRSIGVLASGPWTITAEPLVNAPLLDTTLSGEGDDVVRVAGGAFSAEVASVASVFAYSLDGREDAIYSSGDSAFNTAIVPEWADVLEILDHDPVRGWTITRTGDVTSSESGRPPLDDVPASEVPGAIAVEFSTPLDPNLEWMGTEASGPAVDAGLICSDGVMVDIAYFDANGSQLTSTEFDAMMSEAYGLDSEPEHSIEYTVHSEFSCAAGPDAIVLAMHYPVSDLPLVDPATVIGGWSIIDGTGGLEGLAGDGQIVLDMESFTMKLNGWVFDA